MSIHPLKNWVRIKPIKTEKIGQIFCATGKQLRYDKGEVLAVGPGILSPKGILLPIDLKPGDLVLYQHLCPRIESPHLSDKDDTILVQDSEIYCVFETLDQVGDY